MKKLLKNLIDTHKYRTRCNTLELQLDNAIQAYEELKMVKMEELLSYKEKYESTKTQLANSRKRVRKQKEIIKEYDNERN